jgi:hypothetical protein
MRAGKTTRGALLGVAVTPVAALLAVWSAGAGHGHYVLARLLFPYSMLLTRATDDSLTLPLLALGLVQWPLYGALLGFAASRGRALLAAILLLVAHAGAAALCFSGLLPNFS